jgi:peptide/nickel transport system ATP-binding protein
MVGAISIFDIDGQAVEAGGQLRGERAFTERHKRSSEFWESLVSYLCNTTNLPSVMACSSETRSLLERAAPRVSEERHLPLLSIENLSVSFRGSHGWVRALHNFNLDIGPGESLGIVGESGSGKSVTWLGVLGLLPIARVEGSARMSGAELIGLPERRLAAWRGKRIAMIFQDPTSSLNPVHRIGGQIAESLSLHQGLSGVAARTEARRFLERVHIPDAAQKLNAYPHELSGGMNQRVMIALALAGNPDVLVADEPTTALDATIQAQIIELLKEIRRDTGMALVTISHDLGVIAELADRVVVMYAGRSVEEAPVERIFRSAGHPYTQGLLAAVPQMTGVRRRLVAIPGQTPEPSNLPSGCAFSPRCPFSTPACDLSAPSPVSLHRDHWAACREAEAGLQIFDLTA